MAYESRCSSFLVEKLLTPMAQAWPVAYKPSIAFHVSRRHNGAMTSGANPCDPGFVLNGQCICNKNSGNVNNFLTSNVFFKCANQMGPQFSSIGGIQDTDQCSQAGDLLMSCSVPLRHLLVHGYCTCSLCMYRYICLNRNSETMCLANS